MDRAGYWTATRADVLDHNLESNGAVFTASAYSNGSGAVPELLTLTTSNLRGGGNSNTDLLMGGTG